MRIFYSFRDRNINSLNPNTGQHLITPYNITTWLNLQVKRIKQMIKRDEMCLCLKNSHNQHNKKNVESSEENMYGA